MKLFIASVICLVLVAFVAARTTTFDGHPNVLNHVRARRHALKNTEEIPDQPPQRVASDDLNLRMRRDVHEMAQDEVPQEPPAVFHQRRVTRYAQEMPPPPPMPDHPMSYDNQQLTLLSQFF